MTDENVKVLFGRRVRQLRERKGLSQEKFAHIVGLDRSYVGSVERGERNISLENIVVIANGLGVSAAELLMFEKLEDSGSAAPVKRTNDSTNRRGKS